MDLLLRAPESLVMELDARVDRDRFKNRTHLILVILADWLAREIHPSTFFSDRWDLEQEEAWFRQDRIATKRTLLGEDWEKYKNSGGDMLDGEWETQRSFERLEAQSRAIEQRALFKEELREELRKDLKAELLAALRAELGGEQEAGKEKAKTSRNNATSKGKQK